MSWSLRPGEVCGAQKARSVAEVSKFGPVRGGWMWRRVSERDKGVKLMQEWKTPAEGKGSVCKGIWENGIGKHPAIRGGVRTLQALTSGWCKPVAPRSREVPPSTHLDPARQKPHGRHEFTLNHLWRPFLPEESNQLSVGSYQFEMERFGDMASAGGPGACRLSGPPRKAGPTGAQQGIVVPLRKRKPAGLAAGVRHFGNRR